MADALACMHSLEAAFGPCGFQHLSFSKVFFVLFPAAVQAASWQRCFDLHFRPIVSMLQDELVC